MKDGVNGVALGVFIFFFVAVTVMGFLAARWRKAENEHSLDEWGLGGRSFGTWVTWFLLGGDLYTAYTFVAVPAAIYAAGAAGFFAVPYTILVYPLIFTFLPRLWSVSHKHGYVTTSDFVRGRFGSKGLSLAVAVTGILATMPYIALQLVGIQAVLDVMGVGGGENTHWFIKDLPLLLAFGVLAAYTYSSGLRAPALIAFVKDTLIYIVIAVAIIYIPIKLGGFDEIDLVVDAAGVVAEAQLGRRADEVLPAFEAGGAGADELLVVVERQRLLGAQPRVGLPVLDEGLGLLDLALPLVDGPGPDAAVGPAEVPVEVGADLVALLPRPAEFADGGADALGVVEADVGAPGAVLRRVVEGLLLLGQQVHAAEEVRHGGVVLLADRAEVGEELLAVLAGAVPGEDDELRRGLARLEPLPDGLAGLGAGVGGGAVTDQADRVRGGGGALLGARAARRALRGGSVGARAAGEAGDQGDGEGTGGERLPLGSGPSPGGCHPPTSPRFRTSGVNVAPRRPER